MFRIGQEEIDAVARVVARKELFKTTPDGETENFEKELKAFMNVDYTLSMTSGMAALTSALVAMGIGPGDEVIVPAYTYIATAMAVISAGAMPVVADIDATLMLDADAVEKAITPKTKAIIPVHMMGYVVNMDKIMAVAKKHNLLVLEDACQCVGGKFGGKRVGTIGDTGAFSFNFFKNISAGEGGAFFTNTREYFEKALIYHDSCACAYFGNQLENFTTERFCGTEVRTNEFASAILRAQLARLDGIIEDLHKNKKIFKEMLAPYFNFIPENDPEGSCATAITLQFGSPEETNEIRDRVKEAGSGISIPANMGKHIYSAWDIIIEKRGALHPLMNPFNFEANKGAKVYKEGDLPVSDRILSSCAHININPDWTEAEMEEKAKLLISCVK